ncbi:MAG: hypothetical protein GX567_04420 [Clostridia bacterium]|nr:hypothetical protein [Clostridia bacterium]
MQKEVVQLSPTVFGEKIDRETILSHLKSEPDLFRQYTKLTPELRNDFLDYCSGNRGIKITYDTFFKYVFDPERTPERLSAFISCLLGKEVHVKYALPLEGSQIIEEGSLVVMDIIVELEDGSLANVEIQKLPYLFPGERSACYSSDLVLRQYASVKSQKKKGFKYGDLKTVYTIVILEKSTEEFHKFPKDFIHKSRQIFDTGLELHLLQEFLYVPLDIFLESGHTIDTEADAWLKFLTSDEPKVIMEIITKFPSFIPLYKDIFEFRQDIKEVLHMYSKALEEMDRNTIKYMIDLQKEEIEKQKEELEKLKEESDKQKRENEQLRQQLEELRKKQKE